MNFETNKIPTLDIATKPKTTIKYYTMLHSIGIGSKTKVHPRIYYIARHQLHLHHPPAGMTKSAGGCTLTLT